MLFDHPPISHFDAYVHGLNGLDETLIGAWRQGSTVLGYADEHSDIDTLFVWQTLPEKHMREAIIRPLDVSHARFYQRPGKGMESFKADGKAYGQSHIVLNDLLNIYPNLMHDVIQPKDLWRLGGLEKGDILFDVDNTLGEYKKTLVVTDAITQRFIQQQRPLVQRLFKKLSVAAARGDGLSFIEYLHNIILIAHCVHYLTHGLWPMSYKWVMQEAKTYGWENEYVNLVDMLNKPWLFKDVLMQTDTMLTELNLLNG